MLKDEGFKDSRIQEIFELEGLKHSTSSRYFDPEAYLEVKKPPVSSEILMRENFRKPHISMNCLFDFFKF